MTEPSPEVYLHTLRHLVGLDVHREPLELTGTALVGGLTEPEAGAFPQAFEQALGMLHNDIDRARAAAVLASELDLFEVAGTITRMADETGDLRIARAAAALCGNPSADRQARATLNRSHGDNPWIRIRYDHEMAPETDEQKRLLWQIWPGRAGAAAPAEAPVVVVDKALPPQLGLALAARLALAGASVRRLGGDPADHMWFGRHTVVVCADDTLRRLASAFPTRRSEQAISAGPDSTVESLLSAVDAALPEQSKLNLPGRAPDIRDLLTKDMYMSGAYTSRDAAFLSGTTRSVWSQLRTRGILQPLDTQATISRWAFRHVVAVRIWANLRKQLDVDKAEPRVARRVGPSIIKHIAGLVDERIGNKLNSRTEIGVTEDGKVKVKTNGHWLDIGTDQAAIETVIRFDRAFQPFGLADVETIGLPMHKDETATIPTILDGVPHLAGHRISAKVIATAHGHGGDESVESAFPQLRGVPYGTTRSVGMEMAAHR